MLSGQSTDTLLQCLDHSGQSSSQLLMQAEHLDASQSRALALSGSLRTNQGCMMHSNRVSGHAITVSMSYRAM